MDESFPRRSSRVPSGSCVTESVPAGAGCPVRPWGALSREGGPCTPPPPRPQPRVCPPPRPVSLLGLGLGLGLGAAAHSHPASMFCPQTGLAGRPLSVPPQDPSPSPAGHGFYTHVLVVRAFSVCPRCGTAGVRGQAGPCPLARWRPCPAPGPRPRSARPACRRALRLVLSSCFPRGPPDGGDCCQTPFFKK